MTDEEFKAIKALNDAAYSAFESVNGKVSGNYLERIRNVRRETDDLVDELNLYRVSRVNQR